MGSDQNIGIVCSRSIYDVMCWSMMWSLCDSWLNGTKRQAKTNGRDRKQNKQPSGMWYMTWSDAVIDLMGCDETSMTI
jgi:hypothetical protein